jgi:hypothetical protein
MSMITIVSIATERSSMRARPVESLLPLTPLSYHVLLALVDGEMHGYAILRDIEERAAGAVRPGTGNALRRDSATRGRGSPRGVDRAPSVRR